MMFHPNSKELCDYVDAVLPDEEYGRLAEHLDKCEKCRERVRIIHEVERGLTLRDPFPESMKKEFLAGLPESRWSEADNIGEFESVIGSILVFSGNEETGMEAFPGLSVKKGDTIKVGNDSLGLVSMNDGSKLYLNKGTRISIKDEGFDIRMLCGEIFSMMMPQKDTFMIKTPSALLKVIGTDFDASVTDDDRTILKVFKGKVACENEAGETIVKRKRQVVASMASGHETSRIRGTGAVKEWTEKLGPGKRKGMAGMKIAVALVAVILAVVGFWAFGNIESSVSRKDAVNENEYNLLDKYREIQSRNDFRTDPFAAPMYLVENSADLNELSVNFIKVLPSFIVESLTEKELSKLINANGLPPEMEPLAAVKQYFANYRITRIEMSDNPGEGSIAVVFGYNGIDNDEDFSIHYYEDGVWKFFTNSSFDPGMKDIAQLLSRLGLIIKDYKLIDYSDYVKDMKRELSQR